VLPTLRAPLDLVLRNLAGNALQHHDKASGTVTVACEDRPLALAISISDDGPGIDPRHHAAIFLPFRTLKGGEDCNSTGMGLAAVKKTIESAGGTIEVTSNAPAERGTTFKVIWPKALRD
jgi:signal transduction histidine kinase